MCNRIEAQEGQVGLVFVTCSLVPLHIIYAIIYVPPIDILVYAFQIEKLTVYCQSALCYCSQYSYLRIIGGRVAEHMYICNCLYTGSITMCEKHNKIV